MATESHVGMALRQRRQELGIPLAAVSNSMNIRERVLETIESGDFDNYPPKGHASGIISSYARYLDMEPRPLLQQFDREYESYLANKQDITGAQRARGGRNRSGRSQRASRTSSTSQNRASRASDASREASRTGQNLRHEHEAESDNRYTTGSVKVVGTRGTGTVRGSRDGGRSGRTGSTTRTGSARASSSIYRSNHSDYVPTGRGTAHYASIRERQEQEIEQQEARERAEGRERASSRNSSRSTRRSPASSRVTQSPEKSLERSQKSTPNFFGVEVEEDGNNAARKSRRRRSSSSRSGRSQSSEPRPDENIFERISRILKSIFSERRTRIIALAFTAIVLGVIIAASVLISTAGNKDSGLIEVQGGAVNDTTTSDGNNAAHKTITTANGNPVTIKISVADGETSLISITYDGGNPYSGTAVGPFTREFPVTESFSATFGNPNAVTVSENGNPIEIAKNNDGTGSLSINIQAANSTSSQTG